MDSGSSLLGINLDQALETTQGRVLQALGQRVVLGGQLRTFTGQVDRRPVLRPCLRVGGEY